MATDGTGKMFEELKKIEARIGSDDHMCGGQFTLADLFAFVTIGQFRAGFLDGIPEAMRGEAWWEGGWRVSRSPPFESLLEIQQRVQ